MYILTCHLPFNFSTSLRSERKKAEPGSGGWKASEEEEKGRIGIACNDNELYSDENFRFVKRKKEKKLCTKRVYFFFICEEEKNGIGKGEQRQGSKENNFHRNNTKVCGAFRFKLFISCAMIST